MDFWDLTKLLFRRWYLMVPMLVVSVVVAVYVGSTVKPDYEGISNLQLIPPTVTQQDQEAGITNQWLNLGINALAQAAIVTLQGKTVVDDLESRGLSTNFTVEKAPYDPLITITVTGESEAQTVATAERIADLYEGRITSLQKQQGVIDRMLITTERLDQGDNLTASSSKLKRALVAIIGAGVLLTAAVTIGTDAWLRRRARRKSAEDEDDALDAVGVEPVVPTPPLPRNGNKPTGTAGVTFRPITSSDEAGGRAPEPTPGPDGVRRPGAAVPAPSLSLEFRSGDKRDGAREPVRDEPTSVIDRIEVDDEPTAAVVPEDATIVLPLSHNRWAARDGSSKRR